MSSLITKLTAGLAVLMGLLAMIFRASAKAEKADKERAIDRANNAEHQAQQLQNINIARGDLKSQQRQEQRDEEEKLAAGDRSHFSDEW